MTNLPRPPAHLEPYVRILGVEGAIAFFLAYGGGELYIPRRAAEGSPLAQLVGIEAARALGAAADRLPRRVPTAKPWIAQVRAAQGLRVVEIARSLHVSDVTVRAWLKGAKRPAPEFDPRQPRLI